MRGKLVGEPVVIKVGWLVIIKLSSCYQAVGGSRLSLAATILRRTEPLFGLEVTFYTFSIFFKLHIMRLVKRSKPGGKVDLDPSWIRWKNGVGPSDTTGKDCLIIQARFHLHFHFIFNAINTFQW